MSSTNQAARPVLITPNGPCTGGIGSGALGTLPVRDVAFLASVGSSTKEKHMVVTFDIGDSSARDALTRALWDGLSACLEGSTLDDLIFDAGSVRNTEAEVAVARDEVDDRIERLRVLRDQINRVQRAPLCEPVEIEVQPERLCDNLGHIITDITELEEAFFDAPKERRNQLLWMLDGARDIRRQLVAQLKVVA